VIEGPALHSADTFVRLAKAEDGPAIGEVHAAAWQLGFGHMLGGEFLERAAAGRLNGWQYAITHVLALSNLVLVAGRDTHVLAFSQSGQPDDGDAGLEIFAFYCHPVAWGTGMADALMQDTRAVLSTRARRAVLWTPNEAHRARRFYERCGFTRTGRTRSEPLSDWQPTPTYEEVAALEYALSLG
jgi:GNAT superfamily N-acetyltransferase